ncbi:hypothetical protein LINPERPRIM_LOCUS22520 [Linum perenne]
MWNYNSDPPVNSFGLPISPSFSSCTRLTLSHPLCSDRSPRLRSVSTKDTLSV